MAYDPIVAWEYDDGGRAAAGFRGQAAGDCVARALAIATQEDYRTVYDRLNRMERAEFPRLRRGAGSARTGITKPVIDKYMKSIGAQWVPTMKIGSGCKVHLRADELPKGRLVVNCSKHLTAVIDGVIHDTHDPSRGGTRCVYGYWIIPETTPA